jgi:hypothetical protein
MADTTTPLYENYTMGPGPYVDDVEVDDPDNDPTPIGTLAVFDTGKLVTPSGDDMLPVVVIGLKVVDGTTYAKVDPSGAIVTLVADSGCDQVGKGAAIVANNEAAVETDPTKIALIVVKPYNAVTGTAEFLVKKFAQPAYAS